MLKKGLVVIWLLVLLSAIGALFWYTDWIYQLPTPIPDKYKPVSNGTVIPVHQFVKSGPQKPVFLHFYNPDCPCSRFNKPHFKSLVRQYGHRVNFVVVVMSYKTYSVQAIREKLDLDLPIVFDQSIARHCGVYSTPQAAILDTQQRLFYRGNYNRSRYCTDEKTNYAQLALAGLLQNNTQITFDQLAVQAYGCTLPYCKTDL
ncbi:hypothetical protein GCM10027347_27510 [Larkinella harenae]